MSKYCDIDLIREEAFPMQYAVGLQNNSAYNNYISEGLVDPLHLVLHILSYNFVLLAQKDHSTPSIFCIKSVYSS